SSAARRRGGCARRTGRWPGSPVPLRPSQPWCRHGPPPSESPLLGAIVLRAVIVLRGPARVAAQLTVTPSVRTHPGPARPAPSTLGRMELLPLALVSGWACGVNTWLTVLVLGVLGRFAAFAEVPELVQRTDVLVVVGLLALVELVADKMPFLGTAWDVVGTVLRPVAGGVVGALLGGADGSVG